MIKKYQTFYFLDNFFDEKSGRAEFDFSLDNRLFFKEIIDFHMPGTRPKALDDLHIALGVSYFKTYLPENIELGKLDLTVEQAAFWRDFYVKGLGEFSYRNNVDVSFIKFPASDIKKIPDKKTTDKKVVIPVGGGKDSTVVIEAVKNSVLKSNARTFSVGFPRPIRETVEKSGLKHILVERVISDTLKTLPDALNGHVPISGIIAFILLCAADLYDFNWVLMANERSANVGNIGEVNHQWSKSLEFEDTFNRYVRDNITNDFRYVSFLRPLSEIHIAKLFSSLSDYHRIFTSCNKAFKLDAKKRIDYWCCNCDKCRFVFLILSLFMKRDYLVSIFGKNMLNDMDNLRGYEELVGLSGIKPFECVGEISECRAAMMNLSDEWANDAVVKNIRCRLPGEISLQPHFSISDDNRLDDELRGILNAFIATKK